MYHPVNYNERKIQLQLTNLNVGIHDLICSCQQPAFHTSKILLKQLSGELTKQQKSELKRCLGTEEDTPQDGGDHAIVALDFGDDLEKIFQDSATEDNDG